MKTKPAVRFAVIKRALCFFLFIACFIKCKKDDVLPGKFVSAGNVLYQTTDGVITIQTGILPPVTQQTFIANGDSSLTQFQIISSRSVLLRRVDFTAPITYISGTQIDKIYSNKVLNDTGMMTYFVNNFLTVGTGASLNMSVFYKPVTIGIPGSVAQVTLKHISYVTEDNVMHDFYPLSDNKSMQMCLVYNKLHLMFQNPSGDILKNNYKQIAEVKLSGDTAWTLKALPLNIFASKDYNGSILNSKLIVKSNGSNIQTRSDSIQVAPDGSDQTVIHFTGGFHHKAGATEIIKIFAPVSGTDINFITSMLPYKSLEWTDSLKTDFKAGRNDQFYKSNTGFSSYTFHQQ